MAAGVGRAAAGRRAGVALTATTVVLALGAPAQARAAQPHLQAAAAARTAAATAAPVTRTLAEHLAGPLQLAVARDGTVYVAQDFAGKVTALRRDGTTRDIVSTPGKELVGVSLDRHDKLTYTSAAGGAVDNASRVLTLRRGGSSRLLADTYAYERRANPDGAATYGFTGVAAGCAPPAGADLPPFTTYRGQVDTHAYATAVSRDGTRYVADAGGNDLLRLRHRRLSTVAVFPPVRSLISPAAAVAVGAPCLAGATFIAEPVPTDVEVGPHGMLYVTTLPGGPEDATLGARGSVWQVDPATGHIRRLATGLLGAANLAVTPGGTVYVSELFAGRISQVASGHLSTVLEVAQPAALEWAHGRLYAGVGVFGDGKVISFRP